MDIVERLLKDISPLRDLKSTERNKLHRDAANEIERLQNLFDVERSDNIKVRDLLAKANEDNERLREENQRQKEKIMLLNSMVQTEHEIIRVATLKEGE